MSAKRVSAVCAGALSAALSASCNTNVELFPEAPGAIDETFGDGGIGIGWFQEFQARFSGWEHRHVDMLGLNGFTMIDRHAERVAVKTQRLVDRLHGYAEVINGKFCGAIH